MSRPDRTQGRLLTPLLLLWLAGVALRLTILAVPPVIPIIHDELNLSATDVGILTGLPSMLFALAAVPGSLLIARLGINAALVVGLALTAIGGALRGSLPDVMWLYAMTIVMGAGVAVMQVTMPPAVRAWVPHRIGFATAVYTNGLLLGEILPVVLMFPLVFPLAGGSWQWAFVMWSVPVAVIALIFLMLAPPSVIDGSAPQRRWWPDWRNALIWRLGIMLGTINATYFATNAFVPDYLRSTGQSEWIGAALSGLNVGQLPASFLLLAFAGHLERKTWPYIVCGLLCVHRVTAAMFTISYSCAVIVPVISGLAWDLTGVAKTAFLPIALCGILLVILAPAINHIPRTGS